MSMEDYAVFIAPKGSKVEAIVQTIQEERLAAQKVRNAFVKEHQAIGTYGRDAVVIGLLYKHADPLPPGLRTDRKHTSGDGNVAVPNLKTPEGKAWQAKFRALPPLPDSDVFTTRIGSTWAIVDMRILKCWYEKIGETLFVMTPYRHAEAENEDQEVTAATRTCFKPEGCEQVGLSRYYAAKEALTAQKAA